jgi:hypothetical protein
VIPEASDHNIDIEPIEVLRGLNLGKCAYPRPSQNIGFVYPLDSRPPLVNKTYAHFLQHMKKVLLAEYDWETLFIEAKSIEWFTSGKGRFLFYLPGECGLIDHSSQIM